MSLYRIVRRYGLLELAYLGLIRWAGGPHAADRHLAALEARETA